MTTLFGRTVFAHAVPHRLVRVGRGIAMAPTPTVRVGAHAVEEYVAKIGRLHTAVECTNRDVERYTVWDDPTALRAKAVAFDFQPTLAQKLRDDADVLDARAKGQAPAAVAAQIAFGHAWNDFYPRWGNSYGPWSAGHIRIDPFFNDWDIINGYETEFDRLRARYLGLHVPTDCGPRVTDTDIEKDPSHQGDTNPFTAGIETVVSLLKWTLIGGVVIGVGVLVLGATR